MSNDKHFIKMNSSSKFAKKSSQIFKIINNNKENKSRNQSAFNNHLNLNTLANNKTFLKNKSLNISSSNGSVIKFCSNKTIKNYHTLGNKKAKTNDINDRIYQMSLFDKLKIILIFKNQLKL